VKQDLRHDQRWWLDGSCPDVKIKEFSSVDQHDVPPGDERRDDDGPVEQMLPGFGLRPGEGLPEEQSPLDRAFAPEQAAAIRGAIDDSSHRADRFALWRDELVAWVKTFASAAVYATLIITFVFQVARVDGTSMAPTLADQDRLIVNKLAYRVGDPQRGDIVMLYYPLDPEKSFVKRVIAEPNDTVRIVNGRVYVNDVALLDEYVPAEYRSHEDYGPRVVDEGYYFVMGDHRNNSSDSRHWGPVPKKYIVGKVQLRWWPVPSGRLF
jgi:signal peptidase I